MKDRQREQAVLLDVVWRHESARNESEAIAPLQHALQCAQLAENEGAPVALITAALLHGAGQPNEDDREPARVAWEAEAAADAVLGRWFGPEVCEPVRLLPAARRYLCAVEPGYLDALSHAARHAVACSGGPMSGAETTAFEGQPFAGDALRLLRWKDRCQAPLAETASLAQFLPYALGCMRWDAR